MSANSRWDLIRGLKGYISFVKMLFRGQTSEQVFKYFMVSSVGEQWRTNCAQKSAGARNLNNLETFHVDLP